MGFSGRLLLPVSFSPPALLIRPSDAPLLLISFQRHVGKRKDGKNGSLDEDLTEEFKRAGEKAKAEAEAKLGDQGVASQTFDRFYEAAEEAILGNPKVESVKNRLKQHELGATYHKPTDG